MSEHLPGIPIYRMRIKYEPDIVTARQKTRLLSQLFGITGQDRARLSTAVSELARNVYQYAGGGIIEFYFADAQPQALFVRVSDSGPGIKDINAIFNGTYRSKTGMGVGLSGSKKLMDHFDLQTEPDKGTVVTIGKNLPRPGLTITKEQLPDIALKISQAAPDNAFEEIQNQNSDLLNALEDARVARHELTALNSKLTIAYEDAANANQAKTQFLSNMSHEIRTPLGLIIGFADLAMEPSITSIERNRFLSTIKKNAAGLTELIGEILDVSKIEAGKIELENIEFSLSHLLHETILPYSLIAKDKGVLLSLKIEGSFPTLVHGDPTRSRQILTNLLNNALKFTATGEVEVEASARPCAENAGTAIVEISVRDSGIGIAPEKQTRLFESFMQADSSTTRKFGGTGLGLSLSKSLAEAMGGSLYLLTSQENVGSTFCVSLKFAVDSNTKFQPAPQEMNVIPEPRPSAGPAKKDLEGMRLLLVEDSPENQFLFKRYLNRAGAVVESALDGLEGVELAKLNHYHAILMDVQMPNLDGYGATRRIRKLGIEAPIIALTAHAMKDERERALRSGFNGYLIKPINVELLIETLQNLVGPTL